MGSITRLNRPAGVIRTEHRFVAMGGSCSLRIDSEDGADAEKAAIAAEAEVRRLERKFSRFLPDSLVTAINNAAGLGRFIPIDSETEGLLNFADTLWQQSGGLFDPTSGVLRQAWDFRSDKLPRQESLDRLLPLVGWERVQRGPGSVYLPHTGMELDLGGYVKEYAADAAASVLRSHGMTNALVDLAGDMQAVGSQGNGEAWRIGIRSPGNGDQAVGGLNLTEAGLASSGNYERCINLNGKRYGHILNPHTGWPVEGLAAVSVSASQCLVAGGIATIAMLLPANKALSWITDLGVPFLAVDADQRVVVQGMDTKTETFHESLRWLS